MCTGQRSLLARFLAGASWCSCASKQALPVSDPLVSACSKVHEAILFSSLYAADISSRRLWRDEELYARARRNAEAYALIGILERFNESMHLLATNVFAQHSVSKHGDIELESRSKMTSADIGMKGIAHRPRLRNSLESCISRNQLPASDIPTRAQEDQVAWLLKADVELYRELDKRLLKQLQASSKTLSSRPSPL